MGRAGGFDETTTFGKIIENSLPAAPNCLSAFGSVDTTRQYGLKERYEDLSQLPFGFWFS